MHNIHIYKKKHGQKTEVPSSMSYNLALGGLLEHGMLPDTVVDSRPEIQTELFKVTKTYRLF